MCLDRLDAFSAEGTIAALSDAMRLSRINDLGNISDDLKKTLGGNKGAMLLEASENLQRVLGDSARMLTRLEAQVLVLEEVGARVTRNIENQLRRLEALSDR